MARLKKGEAREVTDANCASMETMFLKVMKLVLLDYLCFQVQSCLTKLPNQEIFRVNSSAQGRRG
jgi:hypothetical protein